MGGRRNEDRGRELYPTLLKLIYYVSYVKVSEPDVNCCCGNVSMAEGFSIQKLHNVTCTEVNGSIDSSFFLLASFQESIHRRKVFA